MIPVAMPADRQRRAYRAIKRGLRREAFRRSYEPTEHPYATRIKLLEDQIEEVVRIMQAVMARLDTRDARRGM